MSEYVPTEWTTAFVAGAKPLVLQGRDEKGGRNNNLQKTRQCNATTPESSHLENNELSQVGYITYVHLTRHAEWNFFLHVRQVILGSE